MPFLYLLNMKPKIKAFLVFIEKMEVENNVNEFIIPI